MIGESGQHIDYAIKVGLQRPLAFSQIVNFLGQIINSLGQGINLGINPLGQDIKLDINLLVQGIDLHMQAAQIEDAPEYPDNYSGSHAHGGHADTGSSENKYSVQEFLSAGTGYISGMTVCNRRLKPKGSSNRMR